MANGKKVLPIDMQELFWALDDSSLTIERYVDLETGEIVECFELDDVYFDESEEEMELEDPVGKMVEENPGRFAFIDPLASHQSYRHMEAFIPIVQDPHLRELLAVAINGRGAFRRFKDVLLGYPEEEERWFEFKDAKMLDVAMEFLNSIGVEPAPAEEKGRGEATPDDRKDNGPPG